jgi:hypothetical protein
MTAAARVVVRPRRLTVVCRLAAGLVVAVFAVVATALRGGPEGDAQFQLADQVAMFVLGLLIAAGVLSFTRARVVADEREVRVRNVVGEKVLPWQVVAAVRLDEHSPWASLELHDDDTVALLAVQANDGESAVDAVVRLRRLLHASRRPGAGGDSPPG